MKQNLQLWGGMPPHATPLFPGPVTVATNAIKFSILYEVCYQTKEQLVVLVRYFYVAISVITMINRTLRPIIINSFTNKQQAGSPSGGVPPYAPLDAAIVPGSCYSRDQRDQIPHFFVRFATKVKNTSLF